MEYRVIVYDKNLQKKEWILDSEENLMEFLGKHQIFFGANCGGNGRCRQCEVLVNGLRKKACCTTIRSDCKVVLPFEFESMILDTSLDSASMERKRAFKNSGESYTVSVDVGTTTIGMALLDGNRNVLAKSGLRNSQCVYGADVAARIQYASSKEGLSKLQQCFFHDLLSGIFSLCDQVDISSKRITDLYLSGNTVMLHIANGISPESIGSYPFTPKQLQFTPQKLEWNQKGKVVDVWMHSIPCASGYIGSDVMVGAYYYHLHHKEKPCLYVDLGTNGEMILGNRSNLLSTSVAAGPAFEEAMHASSILKALEQLKKEGKMDANGTLSEPYFSKGYAYKGQYISQEHIRQIQLAKAAVRAGIELLCKRFGTSVEEIAQVFVAGGFGFYLKEESAYETGMFPSAWENTGKVQFIGNASLEGNIHCYHMEKDLKRFNHDILNIDLAMDGNFEKEYVRYMNF